jgi:hypothetical protein
MGGGGENEGYRQRLSRVTKEFFNDWGASIVQVGTTGLSLVAVDVAYSKMRNPNNEVSSGVRRWTDAAIALGNLVIAANMVFSLRENRQLQQEKDNAWREIRQLGQGQNNVAPVWPDVV